MQKAKKWLLATLAIAAVVTATVPKKAHATGEDKQAYVINCVNSSGQVTSFGAECRSGSTTCVANPCP